MSAKPQQGFFLPIDVWQEAMEVFDELPHKRVKKITRQFEGLNQLTVTPKEEEAAPQSEGPARVEGAGKKADTTPQVEAA